MCVACTCSRILVLPKLKKNIKFNNAEKLLFVPAVVENDDFGL